MIYLKSTLAGAAISLLAWFVAAIAYLYVIVGPKAKFHGVSVGIDIRGFNGPAFWAIALAAFAVGSYLELRRG